MRYIKQLGFDVRSTVNNIYSVNPGQTKAETTFGIEACNTFFFVWFLKIDARALERLYIHNLPFHTATIAKIAKEQTEEYYEIRNHDQLLLCWTEPIISFIHNLRK